MVGNHHSAILGVLFQFISAEKKTCGSFSSFWDSV